MSEQTGKTIYFKVPDLPAFFAPIASVLEPARSAKVYRMGLAAAAKVILRKARELAPGPGKSKRRGSAKKARQKYGRTGALRKSLKAYYRRSKRAFGAYVVIGANRDTKIPSRRGNQESYSIPASYIHLIEKGFEAVGRISLSPGTQIRGRDLHYEILRQLRGMRFGGKARSISFKKALEQKIDKKLFTNNQFKETKVGRSSAKAYVRGYKRATKTQVPGRYFMKRAQREAREEAIDAAKVALIEGYEKLLSIYRV